MCYMINEKAVFTAVFYCCAETLPNDSVREAFQWIQTEENQDQFTFIDAEKTDYMQLNS